MKNKIGYLGLLGIPLAVLGVVGSVAFAEGQTPLSTKTAEPVEQQIAITGDALKTASEVALAHAGGGRVTETEVGDEESYYQVEVTLDNGDHVDMQLDKDFKVVGQKTEGLESSNN